MIPNFNWPLRYKDLWGQPTSEQSTRLPNAGRSYNQPFLWFQNNTWWRTVTAATARFDTKQDDHDRIRGSPVGKTIQIQTSWHAVQLVLAETSHLSCSRAHDAFDLLFWFPLLWIKPDNMGAIYIHMTFPTAQGPHNCTSPPLHMPSPLKLIPALAPDLPLSFCTGISHHCFQWPVFSLLTQFY